MAWRAGIEARPKLKGNMGANAEEIMKCRLGNFTRAGAWPEAARPDVAVVTRRRQRIAREGCRPGARHFDPGQPGGFFNAPAGPEGEHFWVETRRLWGAFAR